jgi:hypothetical protein
LPLAKEGIARRRDLGEFALPDPQLVVYQVDDASERQVSGEVGGEPLFDRQRRDLGGDGAEIEAKLGLPVLKNLARGFVAPPEHGAVLFLAHRRQPKAHALPEHLDHGFRVHHCARVQAQAVVGRQRLMDRAALDAPDALIPEPSAIAEVPGLLAALPLREAGRKDSHGSSAAGTCSASLVVGAQPTIALLECLW